MSISDFKKLKKSGKFKLFDEETVRLLLNKLDDVYFNETTPLVSDELYDFIDAYYKNTFSIRIVDKTYNTKHKLPYFINSQEKYDADQINRYIDNYSGPFTISTKLDGMSGILCKKDGKLSLYTKNVSGITGHNKSHFLEYINIIDNEYIKTDGCSDDLNIRISCASRIINMKDGDCIRGELIISKENFNKSYKNKESRTVLAGLINNKTIESDKLHIVDFVGFSVLGSNLTISDQFDYIKSLGINCVSYVTVLDFDIDYLKTMLIDLKNTYMYNIDGLVIMDSSEVYEVLNVKYPKYSFSFKSKDLLVKKSTVVVNIKWSIQKNNKMIPVIHFEPVIIDNQKIVKASGHNAKFIENNGIVIGKTVEIVRSGEVIPYVVVKDDFVKLELENGEWDKNHVHMMYIGDVGTEKLKASFRYSVKMLDINGIGSGTVDLLVENDIDFFDMLKNRTGDNVGVSMMSIRGLGVKRVNSILNSAFMNIRTATTAKLMAASGMFNGLSLKILGLISVDLRLLNDVEKYDYLIRVKGYSDVRVNRVIDNFAEYIEWFDTLGEIIHLESFVHEDYELSSIGMNFVITGFRDKELLSRAIDKGYRESGLSKANYLIVKDNDTSNNKTEYAFTNCIIVLTKDEFNVML